ncbi:hypothetical protein K474DRAFT_1706946 [Panus rudis PR-1116 ss-1]|nr:hypothetical protein K474DRAFT_1706946 [Panus rudis PR-1116 ss-1]
MPVKLTDIPEDILFNISEYLTIPDILNLKQTCRVLHAFGSTDYLWHKLVEGLGLPLDLPPGLVANVASADELQYQAMRAMKLERNWRKPTSVIKQYRRFTDPGQEVFVHMQLLPGGKWLLAVQRYHRLLMTRPNTRVAVWSLTAAPTSSRVFSVEFMGNYRCSTMSLLDDGHSAILAIALSEENEELLEIRRIALYASDSSYQDRTSAPVRRIHLPEHALNEYKVIQDVVMQGNILAATVAIFGDNGGVSFHVLLLDTSDENSIPQWVDYQYTKDLGSLRVRVQENKIFFVGQSRNTTVIRVHKLPSAYDVKTSAALQLDEHIAQYENTLPDGFATMADELYIPGSLRTTIPVVMFDAIGARGTACGYVFVFHLTDKAGKESDRHGIFIPYPSATSQRNVQLGATGLRMVWVEHDLESGRNRLMKFSMPTTDRGHIHGVLLPDQPNLPFALNACNAIAFDEISGRLCLALYDGSVHILDFV